MLEQEINKYLTTLTAGQKWKIQPIEEWDWLGAPRTVTTSMRIINRHILDASLEECLTSPSKYVRECKKYFTKQGLDRGFFIDLSDPNTIPSDDNALDYLFLRSKD